MLRTLKSFFVLLILSFAFWACQPTALQEPLQSDQVYQYSTIQALLEGHYDGHLTLGELKKQGDLGIGTFDALDGEMVVLNDTVYQVKTDGLAYLPSDSLTTPYATMIDFVADTTLSLEGAVNYMDFQKLVDGILPSKNFFYAFKLEGVFSELKVRSVPRQTKPYLSIAGTMVGFYFPTYTSEISVPGYHLHFISNDRQRGGHVLFFEGMTAEMELDIISSMSLQLPDSEDFKNLDLTKDREGDLEKVEKLRN